MDAVAKPMVLKFWTWRPCGNYCKTNGSEALDVETIWKLLQNHWFEVVDVDTVWKNHSKTNGFEALDVDTVGKSSQIQWC